MITGDSQLRWVGPEKGVIHLATAAVVNAVWDLWAKVEGKPLWKLLADMTPEQLVALHRLPLHHRRAHAGRGAGDPAAQRADQGRARGRDARATAIPAYTTSAGWLGYSDEKLRRAVPRGAGRGLDALQDEGRARPRRRHAPRAASSARRSAPSAS